MVALDEIAKAILIQDRLEELMVILDLDHLEVEAQEEIAKVILIQDRLEIAVQEEAQMGIHLPNQIEALVRIEIHRGQEVKH